MTQKQATKGYRVPTANANINASISAVLVDDAGKVLSEGDDIPKDTLIGAIRQVYERLLGSTKVVPETIDAQNDLRPPWLPSEAERLLWLAEDPNHPEEASIGQQAADELLGETDRALEAIARGGDRIDALLDQIRAVRAEPVV